MKQPFCFKLAGLALLSGVALAPASALAQAELDALVKAAKIEGKVSFYSAATENVAKRTGDAFKAKYGIDYSFVRTAGVATVRRFASEAEVGTFAIDLYFVSTAVPFALEAIKKGWVEPMSEAGIPAIKSGEFPARFVTGPTAIVQVAPWGIAYNTEKVKGADIPKDWTDLLNPKWKGQVLLPDPRSSDSYSDQWATLMDKYGESLLTRLRDMNPRQFQSGVPATNALSAGEGAFALPAVAAQVQATKEKGAPIGHVIPAYTTGVEMQMVLVNRTKAKNPNAGRLFVHYVMTQEGSKVFNSEPGSFSPFDTANLPKEYVSPKQGLLARREQITKLLGFQ